MRTTTVRTTVAMIMVGTVTVLAAALGGPWRRSDRGFLLPPVEDTAPPGIPTALPTSRPVDPGDKSDHLLGLGVLLWVLAGVAILATCWLLWIWISARLRLSTASKPPEGPLELRPGAPLTLDKSRYQTIGSEAELVAYVDAVLAKADRLALQIVVDVADSMRAALVGVALAR